MTASPPLAPAAEAILNADGEVLVLADVRVGVAVSWDPGPGGLLRNALREGQEAALTLPAEALDAAVANGRLLLAQAGPDGRPAGERWLYRS